MIVRGPSPETGIGPHLYAECTVDNHSVTSLGRDASSRNAIAAFEAEHAHVTRFTLEIELLEVDRVTAQAIIITALEHLGRGLTHADLNEGEQTVYGGRAGMGAVGSWKVTQ